MNIIRILMVSAFAFFASHAQAAPSFFNNTENCKVAAESGYARAYTPTTKAPFKGGKGWTKVTVPAGGACLGEAHVLEDGAVKNGKSVFVEAGFVYWVQDGTGAYRMNDCSNPFGSIVLIGTGKQDDYRPATPILQASNPATSAIAEEGRVYMDAAGNTFERHQGGSRLCKFYVNGELVKQQFVQHPDPVESKKQCDLLSKEFYASLLPTTPEQAPAVYSKPAVAPAPAQVAQGNNTCELKFNGKVVETTKVADDASCKAWTDAKAKEKGWIARK